MDDRLEILARSGIPEDLSGQRGPVDGAVGAENGVSEAFHDRGVAVGAGFDDLARQAVGVDDDRAQLGQARGDGTLAGADAPGQPDEQHGHRVCEGRPGDTRAAFVNG
jgi:hypothetical protein